MDLILYVEKKATSTTNMKNVENRMRTTHELYFENAIKLDSVPDSTIDLVITSPPYPMIEMWDSILGEQSLQITKSLESNDGYTAFELMHIELDKVWDEVIRVTKEGAFICINIGDATRTINGNFALYPNHARIISYFRSKGINNLPNIIWKKQTNSPNKFMGSGMLPSGAYVTLEHEYILIFRKGGKQLFITEEEKKYRRESSFFWEERNVWFSDVWDFKGARQILNNKNIRERSAAFPFELPYRLINMYSIKGNTILDPFVGTGTTLFAALTAGRNSVGYDIDKNFRECIFEILNSSEFIEDLNLIIESRLLAHKRFIEEKNDVKHFNLGYNFPVVTNQEKEILINFIQSISMTNNNIEVDYYNEPLMESPTTKQKRLF